MALSTEILDILEKYKSYILYEKMYSLNTLKGYLKDINLLFIFIYSKTGMPICMTDIKNANQLTIREFLSSKISDKNTKKRKLSAIKSFIKFLIKNDILIDSPILLMEQGKGKKTMPKPASYEDIFNMIEHENSKLIRAIILCLYSTGLRISELTSLKLSDLSNMIHKGEIIIEGKGKKQRIVPMMQNQIDIIAEYLFEKYEINNIKTLLSTCETHPNHFIFTSLKKTKEDNKNMLYNRSISHRYIQKKFHEIQMRYNVSKFHTPHSLRHSFASHMIENDAPLRHVQELMGHQSIRSTQVYTSINTKKFISNHQTFHPRNISKSEK